MNQKLFLCALIFLLVYLGLQKIFPNFFIFKRNPPLTKGLSSNISLAEKQFNTRVKKKFSFQTSDVQISNELSRQGFIIKKNREGKNIALFEEHIIVCNFSWLIDWEVDEEGYIYNLKANYNDVCL